MLRAAGASQRSPRRLPDRRWTGDGPARAHTCGGRPLRVERVLLRGTRHGRPPRRQGAREEGLSPYVGASSSPAMLWVTLDVLVLGGSSRIDLESGGKAPCVSALGPSPP